MDWDVEVPGFVSIDGNGRLTGVSPGTSRFKATIQGTGIVSDNPYPTVTVTAGGANFEIVAPDVSFNHVVGVTSCPQNVGSFAVRNDTPLDAQLQVTAPSQLAFVRSGGGGGGTGSFTTTVGPGTTEFGVRFNCTVTQSFSEQVTLVVSNNRGSADETFTVTGTIEEVEGPAFEIMAPDLSFTHVVGGTACPQELGRFSVTNNTPVNGQLQVGAPSQLDFMLSGGGGQAGSFNLDIGPGTTEFLVRFNCTVTESFSTLVTVVVSNGLGSAEEAFTVTGTIQDGGDTTPPTVTAYTPVSDGARIETLITVTFSEDVDPATLTYDNLRVRDPTNVIVPGPISYDAGSRTVTYTPASPLTEFESPYTVSLTAGVRDLAGNPLVPATWTFTTVLVDPDWYYRVTSELLGSGRSLDTYSNTYQCFMGDTGGYTGQWWFFTPSGTPPYLHMGNAYGGAGRFLEGAIAPDPCILTGSGGFSGEHWKIVPLSGGLFLFQNANFGEARSLDTSLAGGVAIPRMEPTADTPGQRWRLTRHGRR